MYTSDVIETVDTVDTDETVEKVSKDIKGKVYAADSKAYITELADTICTLKFSRMFREKFPLYSASHLQFIGHVLASYRKYKGQSVPIPRNAMTTSSLRWFYRTHNKNGLKKVLADGILTRSDFSYYNHECREYSIGPVLDQLLEFESHRVKIQNILLKEDEKITRLNGGKSSGHRKHVRELMTTLNKQAVNAMFPNLINVNVLDAEYEAYKDRIKSVKDPILRKRMRLKLYNIYHNILSIKRQHKKIHNPDPGLFGSEIIGYVPAYKGSKYGRLYEIGGGMQAMPRYFKRTAYLDIKNLANYDIRSCHLSIIAQLCRQEGKPQTLLEEYISDPKSKNYWAQKAGVVVDLWKECLIALMYGASFGATERSAIYQNILYWYIDNETSYTTDDIDRTYQNMVRTLNPFTEARKTWYDILSKKIIPAHTVNGYKGRGKYLTNSVGIELDIPDKVSYNDMKHLSAYFCQGYESSFICHLTLLSKKYDFQVRSLEHDGMVVTGNNPYYPIPEKAIEKARTLSGFTSAVLEIKHF
jgi:hypothetical protein